MFKQNRLRIVSLLAALVLLISAFGSSVAVVSAEEVKPRSIVLQSWTKWKSYTYGGGTLWATGCGMFSIVNAVGYLTGNEMDVVEVANWGHAIGGYNPGTSSSGTYRLTVYPKLEAKFGKDYGFTVDHNNGQGYWAGVSSSTLKNHLNNGGVAIAHVPGHFIAIVDYDPSTNYFHIYESFPNSKRGTNGTNGDIWRSASQLSTGNLKVDWFCLLSATGSPINRDYGETGCNVSFESNGGTDVSSQSVDDGGVVTKPADPTRWGFDFAGWYSDSALTTPYDFSTTVTGDLTLYAKWTEATWDENTNLMPNESQMIINPYNDADEHIWAYFNDDAYGSVTMYSGVNEEWAWPSASMEYEHCFDAATDAYIYVKKDGTAQFNAEITYMDANGELQTVLLSELAGQGTTDFAEGPMEFFVNIGQYIYDRGHLPASGKVKFANVTYYVIGAKDSYVKLYDMKFTEEFPIDGDENTTAYVTLMDSQITQSGDSGSYVYDNGTLTVNSTGDQYSVTWDADANFDPSALSTLMMDVESDVPFTVTMNVLRADGEATMELKNEFFNHFGLPEAPTTLPAGNWNLTAMDLNGYFEWNGGAVTNTTVSSITVTVYGSGTLTLKALQSSNGTAIQYVEDGITTEGSLNNTVICDINGDGIVSTIDARLVLMYAIGRTEFTAEQCALADVNGDGEVSTIDARMVLIAAITA